MSNENAVFFFFFVRRAFLFAVFDVYSGFFRPRVYTAAGDRTHIGDISKYFFIFYVFYHLASLALFFFFFLLLYSGTLLRELWEQCPNSKRPCKYTDCKLYCYGAILECKNGENVNKTLPDYMCNFSN